MCKPLINGRKCFVSKSQGFFYELLMRNRCNMAAVKKDRHALIMKREHLVLRARVIQAVRDYLRSKGYLEVDTPLRIPAPAPELHIEAPSSGSWFLQPSPELCMKRLLAAGYERIFQVCHCFRQQERGRRHLPEFTLLEWYAAGEDYRDMMTACESLIRQVAISLQSGSGLSYQGRSLDLAAPWHRLSVREAFRRYAPKTADAALSDDSFDQLMVDDIEPNLGVDRPCFLYDYPAARGALARLKPGDSSVAERFELYIAGLELCNGFTELTDAAEQRRRFETEQKHRAALGARCYGLPEKFLDDLGHMPACTGNALGIDRLVMLLADTRHIDDVVTFTPEML